MKNKKPSVRISLFSFLSSLGILGPTYAFTSRIEAAEPFGVVFGALSVGREPLFAITGVWTFGAESAVCPTPGNSNDAHRTIFFIIVFAKVLALLTIVFISQMQK